MTSSIGRNLGDIHWYFLSVRNMLTDWLIAGELVCATGVHMGTMHDSKIYNFCQEDHPLEEWEFALGWFVTLTPTTLHSPQNCSLGDLAYIGNYHCITKHKKPHGRNLTTDEVSLEIVTSRTDICYVVCCSLGKRCD